MQEARQMSLMILQDTENKAKGIHPKILLEQKQNKIKTFFEVSEEWKKTQNLNDTTKLNRVKNHLNPFIGNKPIGEITKQDLLNCIQRLQDNQKLEASRRVFFIVREIMRFAVMKDSYQLPLVKIKKALLQKICIYDKSIKNSLKIPLTRFEFRVWI